MDGRGRALDTVFIERLWRSLKYELIYRGDFTTALELFPASESYFHFYNHERPTWAPPPNPRDLALLFSRMDALRFTRTGVCRTGG